MTTPTLIKTGIKAAIDSVASVGTVFKGQAVVLDDAGNLNVLMAYENTLKENTLRGWQMMMGSWNRVQLTTTTMHVTSFWELDSFQSFRQRSTQAAPEESDELEFDTRNNAVMLAFDSSPHSTLGGAVKSIVSGDGTSGLQLTGHDLVFYGGGPCLMATFTLATIHHEAIS